MTNDCVFLHNFYLEVVLTSWDRSMSDVLFFLLQNLLLAQVQSEPATHLDRWAKGSNRCLAYFVTLIEEILNRAKYFPLMIQAA